MQFREILNNFINASIRKSSNEIAYEMKLNEKFKVFDVIAQSQMNIIYNQNKYRRKIINVLVFAIFDIKTRYDNHYKVIKMKFDYKVYIKLHKKYHLFELKNAKLFNQRVKLFTIFNKYDKLIYKLNLFKI